MRLLFSVWGLLPRAASGLAVVLALSPVLAATPAAIELERLTLAQARTLMLERNRDLKLARHAVEGAEADIMIAGARPNPTLSAGSTRIGPGSGVDPGPLRRRIESSVGVSQLFERGNRRELRTQAAELAASAARSDQGEVERQQRVAVDQAYYELVLAQERQGVAAEMAALFDKTIDAAERRVKAGDLSRTDLARLSVDALRAHNELRTARLERERAQVALAFLIGLERDAPALRAADGWPQVAPVPGAADLERAVDARQDVQGARARVRAADKGREFAQSLRTRDVTAGIQYDRSPADATRNSVGFNVSVPLFTRYYYQGEIRRAEAEYQAAETALERTRAAAMSEIAAALSSLGSAADRVQRFQEKLLAAAGQAAGGAEFAYSRGAIGVMDLLDSRRQLYATRVESITALADYARAHAAWLGATQNAGTTK